MDWGLGVTISGIRKNLSLIQGSKRQRIPDPQHCFKVALKVSNFICFNLFFSAFQARVQQELQSLGSIAQPAMLRAEDLQHSPKSL
jgi:hypothetical protein